MLDETGHIYIVQASPEMSKCKIGKTGGLERRLKEYNGMTGKSKDNVYRYLFTCEVRDMAAAESAIKEKFRYLREEKSKEIYFYNSELLNMYTGFIKKHPLFIKELPVKFEDNKETVKIIKKTMPSLEERGLSQKDIMQKARKAKNDEFYTRYEDVEKEVAMYDKSIWLNTCVFCNCDDAADDDDRNSSAFSVYFMQNFRELGLKKLICTHYGGGLDLFNQGAKGYVYTYIFTQDGFRELKEYPKGYTGSFDDPLSLQILREEADIVCTNPPFSRAADYWKIIIASGKRFLIISNITNIKNHAYIPYFIAKKVWAGYNRVDWYLNPKKQLTDAAGHWYTNIPIHNRPKYKQLKLMPLKDIPEKYKKYDDTGVLIVDNNYIPDDYKKPFAISVRQILNGILEKGYNYVQDTEYVPYINGSRCFGRVLVQKKA